MNPAFISGTPSRPTRICSIFRASVELLIRSSQGMALRPDSPMQLRCRQTAKLKSPAGLIACLNLVRSTALAGGGLIFGGSR